ncbi:helix-turn-helix domain-containing protein [Curtobacterium aurantiacum]|uniref:Helix-turn-helix domain-containing protein n=1 Tax=Curtobacterium aurantiacum TaxID=3236919 RepID=A0ABS5VGS1_9MICO|nr:helix-turn-helix domain-containing protein [Curtobacterium flaccumfaciens]MBT1545302.1 helix-turn-helix domain-containing protein [Curtobacterium flaccumfaciens pv. flaccumfaciens]MBT1588688.1 helix-turn-helix domain-containing protein [Curtobacterium flaccumfaciens pv. flaccumfaciens]
MSADLPRSAPPLSAALLIRDARERAELTQVQLARRAGVTQSVISTYENGRREPSLAALQRMLRAAGFTTTIDLQPVQEPPPLRDRVAGHRQDLVAIVERFGGRNPRLFGSVARGEDGPDSDVDLMIDVDPGLGIFALMRIQDAAERLLEVRVDVVDAAGMSDAVVRTAVPL